MNYVYPKLSGRDLFYLRIGGSGLANCMIVAARAYAYSNLYNYLYISPTWERLGIGVWLRAENDKRFYIGLFKKSGVSGLRKVFLLLFDLLRDNKQITYFNKLSPDSNKKVYFEDLLNFHGVIFKYFNEIIYEKAIYSLNNIDLSDSVAIHIRLGDYKNGPYYVSVEWFKSVILDIKSKTSKRVNFKLFSDGTNEELSVVLQLPDVERVFYGNPLADMVAISRCKMLIGSDSTFSGMAAFLGQVPCVFNKKHYGRILIEKEMELIIGENVDVPKTFVDRVIHN